MRLQRATLNAANNTAICKELEILNHFYNSRYFILYAYTHYPDKK